MIKKEFFISYAHEDEQIAAALARALRQIDDTFVVVNMDKVSLASGINFRQQLEQQLQRSEVLFVVYTHTPKHSFSYTGWEVGYFEGVHRSENSSIISLYLSNPPDTTSDRQGIWLSITPEDLRLPTATFESRLASTITKTHPMVVFMDAKRFELAQLRQKEGLPPSKDVDTAQCVRDMLLSIFEYRKCAPDTTLKPQKQITIKTEFAALEAAGGDLPPDAELVPVGVGGTMSVFGLLERPITWANFCKTVAGHQLGQSWMQAIRTVIASSFPHQINVDNSQIVLSPDNHVYRLILTTSTTFFNGKMDVNLYIVEALTRPDHGDLTTTRLLKGLELASRFRFMFLEKDSRFYAMNLQLMPEERVAGAVRDLVTELNLLQRDAREAGLHEPAVWGGLVPWDLLLRMGREWQPREQRLRAVCRDLIADAQHDEARRAQLVEVILDLETTIGPLNKELIIKMADRLQALVRIGDAEVSRSSAVSGPVLAGGASV
jgi:hypothetical protein